MKKLTTFLSASVFALSSFAASAGPINVSGVTWDPNAPLGFAADSDVFTQSIIGNPGDTLAGWGRIGSINFNNEAEFCVGCELTFEFGGFSSSLVAPLGAARNTGVNAAFSSTGWVIEVEFEFTGGFANLFVDNNKNFDGSLASSTDGSLWLSATPNSGFGATLMSTAWLAFNPTTNAILFNEIINGEGFALFDVTGGAAFGNFDTNTQLFNADIRVTSRFGNRATPENVTLNAQTIPEPASLAILGLGLLGMGALSRRRKA